VGIAVCGGFAVCWVALLALNLVQIRAQRRNSKQALNYYLSRLSALFAVGMFIDNLATFLDYLLVGNAFMAMYVFGTFMQALMTQLALLMLTFSTNHVTVVLGATMEETVITDKNARSMKKSFIAVNVGSTLWSLIVDTIVVVINKRWMLGLVHIMWAVTVTAILSIFWYYLLILVRTSRKLAEAAGVTRSRDSALRKPVLTTCLTSVIVLGLFVVGSLHFLDFEEPHRLDHLDPYFPINELMLLLACITTSYFAWLPLTVRNGHDIIASENARYVGCCYLDQPYCHHPNHPNRHHRHDHY
jgi:hypothetical protein